MKKIVAFFIAFVCVMPCASWGAVNVKSSGVKKAAPVATKQADKMESVTSLLPTVINLVGGLQNLNKQQQQLTADCAPTSSELQLVNDLVKEWAKTGVTTAAVARGSGAVSCKTGNSENNDFGESNESTYENFINDHDTKETCIETFSTESSENTIWYGFPKASSAKKYDVNNKKNYKNISNIYDVFSMITFGEEDYTVSEAAKIAQFKAKAERCAPAKIKVKQAELYTGFVKQTLGNIGKTSGAAGTASVLDTVSSMGGSGNVSSVLPSLGSMATQLFDK